MLPDYPELKVECGKLVMKACTSSRDDKMAPFGGNRNAVVHFEGNKHSIRRADGSVSTSLYKRVHHEYALTYEQLESLTLEELVAKFADMGEDLGEQQFRVTIDELNQTLAGTPNELKHPKDDYITGIFQALERVWIDFDEDGRPLLPQLMAGPRVAAQLTAALEIIEKDPALRDRHERLMARKKEEWRDREADRKLVG